MALHNPGMLLYSSTGVLACGEVVPVDGQELPVGASSAFDAGEVGGAAAKVRGGLGEGDAGGLAERSELTGIDHRRRRDQQVVDLAGDRALEAAQDLLVGLALGTPSVRIGAGARVRVQTDHGDTVQGAVGLP